MNVLLLLLAVTVSSKVDSVVVYPNQVMVIRTGRVTVNGSGELVFPGLPGGLNDNTVRIKVPGMKIGEVQVRRGFIDEPTPGVKKLKDRVEELEYELKELANEREVLKAKDEFLKSVKLGAPELISKELRQGKVSSESWRSALSFVGSELGKVKARELELELDSKQTNELLAAARQEYAAARARVENRKEVRFEYEARPGTYDVRIAYVIGNGASWSPYYELRARPDKNRVDLSYFARLSQRTGEDWNRVRVVLSTSTPVSGIAAPEPQPWYLSIMRALGRAAGKAGIMLAGAQSESRMTRGVDEVGALEAEVRAVETGISLQYVIPGRVTLKSGDPASKLQLTETALPTEFSYYALPRAREQTFLKGRLANSTDFIFLAGEGNTYVGDEFTGSTWLPAVAPQESTEVSFGIDERVKVTRELVKTFKSRGGLFSKTEKARFVYRITVENYHPKPVTIEVVEQVPVSTQKEIKVKVVRVEPRFLEQDKDKGTYTWRPELAQGEKFELEVEFEVEYPAGQRISGLF